MYNIKTLRGTIFCPPIKYSKDFVSSLADLVAGYIPVIVQDNGTLPFLPNWRLSSPDEKTLLSFNGERIDILQTIEKKVKDDTIQSFSRHCETIFKKILENTSFNCYRIALAPSLIISDKDVKAPSLYKKMFYINRFQGEELDTSDFSQVYRIKKIIGDNNIIINHVVNFHAESELTTTNVGNQVRNRYIGDFDINTMVKPEYKFSIDNVKEFFDFAPSCFKDFYNLYLSNRKD